MTESELETFISKAYRIGLIPGSYSPFYSDLMGNINLSFKDIEVDEFILYSSYVRTSFSGLELKIHLNQVAEDKINFTLMVNTTPAIILSVKDLQCSFEHTKYFFKKQLPHKPIYLHLNINQSHSVFMELIDKDPKAELSSGILINYIDFIPYIKSNV